jgi:tRNA (guanine37-N1)-methyltransferase
MRRIDVITIFPGLFEAFLGESMVGIAIRTGRLAVGVHDLREWTTDPHRTVDDSPYGGGPGMVLKPEPLVAAIEELAGPKGPDRTARVIALSPQGERLDQRRLDALSKGLGGLSNEMDGLSKGLDGMSEQEALVLVCGRYEGVDQRAIELAVDEELSIGDYVLSGGEVPAMVIIEGLARLAPGVVGNPESIATESFRGPILEGPQYTRPAEFRGRAVPPVLLSGDHGAVERWRAEQSSEITRRRRPDLLEVRGARETEK